jgi:predicted acetyltransferase
MVKNSKCEHKETYITSVQDSLSKNTLKNPKYSKYMVCVNCHQRWQVNDDIIGFLKIRGHHYNG